MSLVLENNQNGEAQRQQEHEQLPRVRRAERKRVTKMF